MFSVMTQAHVQQQLRHQSVDPIPLNNQNSSTSLSGLDTLSLAAALNDRGVHTNYKTATTTTATQSPELSPEPSHYKQVLSPLAAAVAAAATTPTTRETLDSSKQENLSSNHHSSMSEQSVPTYGTVSSSRATVITAEKRDGSSSGGSPGSGTTVVPTSTTATASPTPTVLPKLSTLFPVSPSPAKVVPAQPEKMLDHHHSEKEEEQWAASCSPAIHPQLAAMSNTNNTSTSNSSINGSAGPDLSAYSPMSIASLTGPSQYKAELARKDGQVLDFTPKRSLEDDANNSSSINGNNPEPANKKIKKQQQLQLQQQFQQPNSSAVGGRPHRCEVCNRGFARPNDLFRHRKSHRGDAPFRCPLFISSSNNITTSLNSSNSKTSSDGSNITTVEQACHQNGGFSRCDTYKNHLKAMHFEYPPGTKKKQRAGMRGRCKACGEVFESSDVWITVHIETGECAGIKRIQHQRQLQQQLQQQQQPQQ